MSRGYFEDAPYCDPPIANGSAIVATTETALWSAAQFSPIPANDARASKMYRVTATGIYSTGASGTLILTPRFGLTTAGTSLGASVTQTVPINLTNEAWYITGLMTIRSVGAAGANSSVMFGGQFTGSGAAGTAGSSCDLCFGGTAANCDVSVASGLTIGWTLSVAGSVTVTQVAWQSLN